MTIDRVDRTVVTETPTGPPGQETTRTVAGQDSGSTTAGRETVRTDSRHVTRSGPGASEQTRRIVVLLFGLIQIVIGARIVLLLLNAREANGLVSGILNISQVFVAPFEGVLQTHALNSKVSELDVTAVVAFIGWTVLEMIVIWALAIFRREPA